MRWRGLVGDVPRAVWAVSALFALVLLAYSQLAPLGRAPDEPAHVDLVLLLRDGGDYPAYDGRRSSMATTLAWAAYAPGVENPLDPSDDEVWLTPGSAPPRHERPTFEEWERGLPPTFANQMPQHPPAYYRVMAMALSVVEELDPRAGPPPLDRTWHLLRVLNVALVAPLPLLCWATVRRLGATGTAATAAAVVPLCVPQLLHVGASVNNDNLLVLLASIDAVLVAGVVRGDMRRSTAAAIGVVTGLALLTKAFALALLPWVALAYGYHAFRHRDRWRQAATGVALAGVIATAVGGWWYVRNVVRHGSPSPSVLDPASEAAPAGFEPDIFWFARRFVTNLVQRFWGNFGSYEVPLPAVLVVVATAAFAGAVAAAWLATRQPGPERVGTPPWEALAVLASVALVIVVMVAVRAHSLYRSTGTTPFIQGRYLFAAAPPIAAVVGIGTTYVFRRWAPLTLLGAATVMHAEAARAALGRWWAEPDATIGRSLSAMVSWSPWPEPATYALAAALVGAAGATAYALWRDRDDAAAGLA